MYIADNTQSPHLDLGDSDKPFELRTQSEKEELYEKIAEQLALIADNYNFNAPGVGATIPASSSFYSSVPSQGSSVDAKPASPTSPTGAGDISPEVEGAVGGVPLGSNPTELPGTFHYDNFFFFFLKCTCKIHILSLLPPPRPV